MKQTGRNDAISVYELYFIYKQIMNFWVFFFTVELSSSFSESFKIKNE